MSEGQTWEQAGRQQKWCDGKGYERGVPVCDGKGTVPRAGGPVGRVCQKCAAVPPANAAAPVQHAKVLPSVMDVLSFTRTAGRPDRQAFAVEQYATRSGLMWEEAKRVLEAASKGEHPVVGAG